MKKKYFKGRVLICLLLACQIKANAQTVGVTTNGANQNDSVMYLHNNCGTGNISLTNAATVTNVDYVDSIVINYTAGGGTSAPDGTNEYIKASGVTNILNSTGASNSGSTSDGTTFNISERANNNIIIKPLAPSSVFSATTAAEILNSLKYVDALGLPTVATPPRKFTYTVYGKKKDILVENFEEYPATSSPGPSQLGCSPYWSDSLYHVWQANPALRPTTTPPLPTGTYSWNWPENSAGIGLTADNSAFTGNGIILNKTLMPGFQAPNSNGAQNTCNTNNFIWYNTAANTSYPADTVLYSKKVTGLVPGTQYYLNYNFYVSGTPGPLKIYAYHADGTRTLIATPPTGTQGWTTYTFPYTPTSASDSLVFQLPGSVSGAAGADFGLDEIYLTKAVTGTASTTILTKVAPITPANATLCTNITPVSLNLSDLVALKPLGTNVLWSTSSNYPTSGTTVTMPLTSVVSGTKYYAYYQNGSVTAQCVTPASSGITVTSSNSCVALAVVLQSFNGINLNSGINLNWETGAESNIEKFNIEMLEGSNGNWTTIGSTASKGIATGSTYSFFCNFIGKLFFRLKMIEMDGSFTYSKIISINNFSTESLQISPNPISENTNLNMYVNCSKDVQVKLIDFNGRIILNNNFRLTVGMNSVNLGIGNGLASGMYLIQVINADGSNLLQQKLIKE